jgi:hypothetical protein
MAEELNNELVAETVEEDENSGVLKVFIYDANGEKVKEELYADFLSAYDFVLSHNSSNPDNPYNIYPGTQFPPKGYKWSKEKSDWVELSLYEKWKKGQLEIPNDCFIAGDLIVRKNLSQLHKEGLYKILPSQKIDEEYNIIVEKDKQELIDEGLLNWDEVYNYYYAIFKQKLDNYLDVVYLKYPRSISFQFERKVEVAKKWLNLNTQDREHSRAFNHSDFVILISEFKDISKQYTINDIEAELDSLSNKIIKKNTDANEKLGKVNNFFDSLYSEIDSLKDKKDFLKLFEFVSGIENKINTWIKSS